MKRIIITPTFRPHFPFNREFLESFRRFAEDAPEVGVHFVSTRDEIDDLRAMLLEFPELDVHAHAFEDLLAESGYRDEPLALLREIGKFAYQSLKKLYALKSLEYDQALILDSEALFVKPVRVNELFDEYYADPFVLYSDLSQRDERWFGGQSDAVVRNAATLLRQPYPKLWFLEYYGWFYDKRIVRDLFATFSEDLLPAIRTRLKADTRVFENQLFYHFVYLNAARYGYRYTSVDDLLTRYLGPDGYVSYMRHFEGEGQHTGIFEMVSKTVSRRNLEALARLFTDERIRFYRFELVNRNQDEQRELIARTPVAVLVSSEGYRGARERIAVCLSGDPRNPRQNLRFLRAFLAENEVDVFSHLWDTADADYIVSTLQPKAFEFEPHPREAAAAAAKRQAAAAAFAAAANGDGAAPATAHGASVPAPQLTSAEAEAAAEAAALHSRQRANELKRVYEAEHEFSYDVVVHLQLDLFSARSLADMIEHIRFQQSGWDGILYVPDMAHGAGLNTQLAFGTSATMDTLAAMADDPRAAADAARAGPEYAFLRHVLRSGLRIRTFPLEYVAVGNENVQTFDFERLIRQTRLAWRSAPLPEITPAALDGYFAARAESVDVIAALGLAAAKVYRVRAGSRGYARYDAVTQQVSLTNDAADASTFFVTTLANGDRTAVHIQPRDAVVGADAASPAGALSNDLYPNADGEIVVGGVGAWDGAFFVARPAAAGAGDAASLAFEWRPGFSQTLAEPRGMPARPAGGWWRNHREEVHRGARLVLQGGSQGLVLVPAAGEVEPFTLEYVPDAEAEAVSVVEVDGSETELVLHVGSAPLLVRLLGLTYETARVLSNGGTGAFRLAASNYFRKMAHVSGQKNERGIKGAIKRQIGKRL